MLLFGASRRRPCSGQAVRTPPPRRPPPRRSSATSPPAATPRRSSTPSLAAGGGSSEGGATVSGPGDPAGERKRSATLTDGRPNRHGDGGMRTWSLSLARGAAVAALSAALLAASPAGAQTSDEKLDDARARIEKLLLAAEQGDASAQFNLGVMYADGEGVPQNYSEAVRWYRLAAEQGDASAQFNLGIMYANGEGVPQDYSEAMRWFQLAAEQGDASATGVQTELHEAGSSLALDQGVDDFPAGPASTFQFALPFQAKTDLIDLLARLDAGQP